MIRGVAWLHNEYNVNGNLAASLQHSQFKFALLTINPPLAIFVKSSQLLGALTFTTSFLIRLQAPTSNPCPRHATDSFCKINNFIAAEFQIGGLVGFAKSWKLNCTLTKQYTKSPILNIFGASQTIGYCTMKSSLLNLILIYALMMIH